jgi:hypothetical protein
MYPGTCIVENLAIVALGEEAYLFDAIQNATLMPKCLAAQVLRVFT